MKTIEIEITTKTTNSVTKKISLELPFYFKKGTCFIAITDTEKIVRVDTWKNIESINLFTIIESHYDLDVEIITKEEFTEQFNKVTNIINEILK